MYADKSLFASVAIRVVRGYFLRIADCRLRGRPPERNDPSSVAALRRVEGDSVGGTPTGATGTVALPDRGCWARPVQNGRNWAVFKFLTVRDLISGTTRRGWLGKGRRHNAEC